MTPSDRTATLAPGGGRGTRVSAWALGWGEALIKNDRLLIFEQFKIDRHLPKFNKARTKANALHKSVSGAVSMNDAMDEDEDEATSREGWEAGRIRFTAGGMLVREGSQFNIGSTSTGGILDRATAAEPWYRRLFPWFRSSPPPEVGALSPAPEPTPSLTIEQFFGAVKNSADELRLVHERLRGYQQALEEARATGQRALCERLALDIEAVRAETQLHAIGLPKYLDEAPVVKFYKESPRGLRLDWIANFLRVVPPEIRAWKVRCDELGIFDNYAVLHYDPAVSSYAKTQEEILDEIRAKQDPILFGLIEGRRRLYYVGDWIDETCDLTLEQIADRLGAAAVGQIPPEWQP